MKKTRIRPKTRGVLNWEIQICNLRADSQAHITISVVMDAGRGAVVIVGAVLMLWACNGAAAPEPARGRFASDLEFLRRFTDVAVLSSPSGPGEIAVAPEYQGRVMTSTTGGSDAPSFGWIGRAAGR